MHSTESPTTTPASIDRVSRNVILVALGIASLLKLLWAMQSAGSVDTVLFYGFARAIDQVGLCAVYPFSEKFNHTPLTGSFILLLYRLAKTDFLTFSFFIRLPCIVADIAVVLAILKMRGTLTSLRREWPLVLFAASPISLMVSGFHGNVDPIMVAVLFFAALAAMREQPVLCGLLYGMACNIKIVPILLGPVFLFYWLSRPGAWRFIVASGALMLAGSAIPLLNCPAAYLHNVFGYGSTWGVWGIPYLLRLTGWSAVQKIDFHGLTHTQTTLASLLKLAVIGGSFTVGWARRKCAPAELMQSLAFTWLVFFTFAPGIGVQYMVWAAPFLLLLSPGAYLSITAATSVFLAVFYHSSSKGRWPWFLAIPGLDDASTALWCAWAVPAWLAFVGVLFWVNLRGRLEPRFQPIAVTAAA